MIHVLASWVKANAGYPGFSASTAARLIARTVINGDGGG